MPTLNGPTWTTSLQTQRHLKVSTRNFVHTSRETAFVTNHDKNFKQDFNADEKVKKYVEMLVFGRFVVLCPFEM